MLVVVVVVVVVEVAVGGNIQLGSKYWDGEAQLGPATKKLVIIWTRPIRQGQPDVYFSAIHWIYLQPMNKQH